MAEPPEYEPEEADDMDTKVLISESVDANVDHVDDEEDKLEDDPLKPTKLPERRHCTVKGCKNVKNSSDFEKTGLQMYHSHRNNEQYRLWRLALRRANGDSNYEPPYSMKICSAHFLFG